MKKAKFNFIALIISFCLGALLFNYIPAIAANIIASNSSAKVIVDGKTADIDAYVIYEANYLKLRDIANVFGASVNWDAANKTVIIYTNQYSGTNPSTPTSNINPDYTSSQILQNYPSNTGETENTQTEATITTEKNENKNSSTPNTVYITPSGKKYHYSSTCGGVNSYAVNINDVGSKTPCAKCAN